MTDEHHRPSLPRRAPRTGAIAHAVLALAPLVVTALPLAAQIRLGFADPADSTGSVTATDGAIVVNAALVANGSGATLDGNTTGVGVNSNLDSGSATTQRRVDGTLATPESITITLTGFPGTIELVSAELGAFRSGDVATFSSSAFDSATGYGSAPWSFDEGTDTISSSDTIGSGIQTIIFDGSPLLFVSGDTVTFSTSSSEGGGVLLNALTFAGPPPPGTLVTGIEATFPSPTLVENPTSAPIPGSSTVAAGNSKGQSFSLAADTDITGFIFEINDVTTTGEFTLEILPTMDNLPWLGEVFSDRGILPAGLAPGDLLRIDLPAPLSLERGSYLAALTGTTATFSLALSNDPLFPQGALVRRNGSTGNNWRLGNNADADTIFAVLGTQDAPAAPGTGPNIIFILADDLGWTDIRTGGNGPNVLDGIDHGSTFYQTPNLARLASEGLSFTHCYVHQNCAPTRAAILSGQYAPRSGNGVYNVSGLNRGQGTPSLRGPPQNEDVPASHVTHAEALQGAGYVTAHFGKYHVGNHEGGRSTMPENQGFDFNFGGKQNGAPGSYTASGGVFASAVGPGLDAWAASYTQSYIDDIMAGPAANPLNTRALDFPALFPNAAANDPQTKLGDNKHLTDSMGDAAIAFMNDHRQGALASHPFFLQFHFYAVHTPIQPRSDLNAKYGGVPNGTTHGNDAYAGLVEGMDQTVGRLLDYLDDPNRDGDPSDSIASDTLVLFCSDNGGHIGPTDNNPLRHRKGSFWDGGLRVPLIVRAPGLIPGGTQTETLVHAVDFYPTLLDFAGGQFPPGITLDGISFAAHAIDPANIPRDREPIYYHFPGYLDQRARPVDVVIKRVNRIDYKLIYNYDLGYTGNPSNSEDTSEGLDPLRDPWQLFDLTNDLSETTDLLDGNYWNRLIYGPIADEMAAQSLAWLTQPGADWNPRQLTVRATGATVPHHPGSIPHVTAPVEESFRILNVAINRIIDNATITFSSAAGFLYDIEATSNPSDPDSWATLAGNIAGQAGSTTHVVHDPGISSNPHRLYRAVVKPR